MKFHSSHKVRKKTYRSGVGLILLNNKAEVFIGKRLDSIVEAWQMPQGGIDKGETALQSLLRESREEIGTDNIKIIEESKSWYRYDLPTDLQDKLWGGKYYGQEQKWFLAQYLGTDEEININTKKPEFIDWKWISFDQLSSVIVNFKQQLYKNLELEFGPIVKKLENEYRPI